MSDDNTFELNQDGEIIMTEREFARTQGLYHSEVDNTQPEDLDEDL